MMIDMKDIFKIGVTIAAFILLIIFSGEAISNLFL